MNYYKDIQYPTYSGDYPPYPFLGPVTTGWTCPKCGRVWGPEHPCCDACNDKISEDEKDVEIANDAMGKGTVSGTELKVKLDEWES